MADNNELQTTRMTDATPGSAIDDKVADLEAALRIITATTADTAQAAVVTFADGDATPSISGGHRFLTANTGATSITDFDDEVNGKAIFVIIGDPNTTIVHGATIKLSNAQNVTLASADTITFVCSSSVWYEVARSRPAFGEGAQLYKGTQSISHNSATVVDFSNAIFETDDTVIDADTAADTITAGGAGLYLISVQVKWASDSTGIRQAEVTDGLGSGFYKDIVGAVNGDSTYQTFSFLHRLAATDAIKLEVKQTSGGALNMTFAYLTASRVGAYS